MRNVGGQKKKHSKDTLKVSFKSFDIDPESYGGGLKDHPHLETSDEERYRKL